MAKLPTPVSVTDEYLKAILDKQDEILAAVKQQKPEPLPVGLIELKEIAKPKKGK